MILADFGAHSGLKLAYELYYKKVCLEMDSTIVVDLICSTRLHIQFVQLICMICNLSRLN